MKLSVRMYQPLLCIYPWPARGRPAGSLRPGRRVQLRQAALRRRVASSQGMDASFWMFPACRPNRFVGHWKHAGGILRLHACIPGKGIRCICCCTAFCPFRSWECSSCILVSLAHSLKQPLPWLDLLRGIRSVPAYIVIVSVELQQRQVRQRDRGEFMRSCSRSGLGAEASR